MQYRNIIEQKFKSLRPGTAILIEKLPSRDISLFINIFNISICITRTINTAGEKRKGCVKGRVVEGSQQLLDTQWA